MGLDQIGKYKILGRIGQGAMGEVYRAHDPLLNRHVAIKTIAPSLGSDRDFKKRFKREAQAAAALNHPHIITVFDLGEEDDITYMAMELLEGKDLRDLIAAGALATLREKLTVMQQVCDGVAFAHSKGVVHRDLKPGNIHIQPNGQAKVLDFGLARINTSDMTRTGTVMGTPHYMSPEQVRGEKVDASSDVFSLGAVFYELLTGRRPFGHDASHNVLMRILGEEPRPIRELAPDVPDLVAAVAERALAKTREGRYADAGAMAATLRRVTQSLPPSLLYGDVDVGPEDAERAPLTESEATLILDRAGGPRVAGSTALDLDRSRAAETALLGTVRPGRTVVGAATDVPPPSRSWVWAVGVVVLAAIGVGTWAFVHRPAPATPATAEEHLDILTDALVTSQVELAREDLRNRDYDEAMAQAERALAYAPENAEAQQVLDEARRTLEQRDTAVADARAAFTAGRLDDAAQALGRVMTLDPRHPVVAELSGKLSERFRQEAEKARTAAQQARAAADRAQATSVPGYADGGRLEREAAALLGRGEFIPAAQKYIESRNAFEKAPAEASAVRAREEEARRAREEAARRAAAAAATPAPRVATATPAVVPRATPSVPARVATPPPTAAPAPPTTTLPPAAAPTATPAALDQNAAILRAVDQYRQSFENRDIALFRSIYPGLSSDEEKKTRMAFDQIKDWQIGLSVGSVNVQGDRATVTTSRQDVVNGRQMAAREWVFHLVRQGTQWRIESMGTGN